VKNGKILFSFTSPLNPGNEEFTESLNKHGDGVKDVAFTVDNCRGIYEKAVSRGAKSVREPEELKDEHGSTIIAAVQTYGDTIHTFV
jgi:4-hydroxyphenylpyruvate dioxygenase